MSVSYDGRGRKFPIVIARGTDVAFALTVTDAAGAPVDMSSATVAATVFTKANASVVSFTSAVSGAGSNVVTLSLTDTQTATLTATGYQWSLLVTRGGDKRAWFAGGVTVVDSDNGGGSTSGSRPVTVDSELNVNVAVAVVGGSGGGGADELDDLSDVTLTSPVNGNVLAYNGTQWVNSTPAGGGDMLAANNLSDLTNATTARTNLGLGNAATLTVDADLATLSLPASTTISTFGASLVDDTNAATARTTLELGTAATTAATDYATAAQGTTADGAVQRSLVDAKGDLLAATADNTLARLAVGTNGHVLTADSAEAAGVKWAAAAGGGVVPEDRSWPVGRYIRPSVGSSSTVITANGRVYAAPIFVPSCTVDRIAVEIMTAGTGDSRIAVFSDRTNVSGYDHFPNLALGLYTIDTTSTGWKEVTIGTPLSLNGWVWLAFLADNGGRFRGSAGFGPGPFSSSVASQLGSNTGGGGFGREANVAGSIAAVGDAWDTAWNESAGAPIIGLRRAS